MADTASPPIQHADAALANAARALTANVLHAHMHTMANVFACSASNTSVIVLLEAMKFLSRLDPVRAKEAADVAGDFALAGADEAKIAAANLRLTGLIEGFALTELAIAQRPERADA